MSNAIEFKVGKLDLSDVSDRDLNGVNRLNQPGTYAMKLTKYEFNPKKADGSRMAMLIDSKGSQFHPLALTFEGEVNGNAVEISHRIFVPITSLWYQKEGGKPTLVFAHAVRDLVQALTNSKIKSVEGIGAAIQGLLGTLDAGGTVMVTVDRRSLDKLNKAEDGTYTITLADGSALQDDEGNEVSSLDHKDLMDQYEAILGRKYQGGVEVKKIAACE